MLAPLLACLGLHCSQRCLLDLARAEDTGVSICQAWQAHLQALAHAGDAKVVAEEVVQQSRPADGGGTTGRGSGCPSSTSPHDRLQQRLCLQQGATRCCKRILKVSRGSLSTTSCTLVQGSSSYLCLQAGVTGEAGVRLSHIHRVQWTGTLVRSSAALYCLMQGACEVPSQVSGPIS